jgi:hypothetical protein
MDEDNDRQAAPRGNASVGGVVKLKAIKKSKL